MLCEMEAQTQMVVKSARERAGGEARSVGRAEAVGSSEEAEWREGSECGGVVVKMATGVYSTSKWKGLPCGRVQGRLRAACWRGSECSGRDDGGSWMVKTRRNEMLRCSEAETAGSLQSEPQPASQPRVSRSLVPFLFFSFFFFFFLGLDFSAGMGAARRGSSAVELHRSRIPSSNCDRRGGKNQSIQLKKLARTTRKSAVPVSSPFHQASLEATLEATAVNKKRELGGELQPG